LFFSPSCESLAATARVNASATPRAQPHKQTRKRPHESERGNSPYERHTRVKRIIGVKKL
jgi:hypothetical protein